MTQEFKIGDRVTLGRDRRGIDESLGEVFVVCGLYRDPDDTTRLSLDSEKDPRHTGYSYTLNGCETLALAPPAPKTLLETYRPNRDVCKVPTFGWWNADRDGDPTCNDDPDDLPGTLFAKLEGGTPGTTGADRSRKYPTIADANAALIKAAIVPGCEVRIAKEGDSARENIPEEEGEWLKVTNVPDPRGGFAFRVEDTINGGEWGLNYYKVLDVRNWNPAEDEAPVFKVGDYVTLGEDRYGISEDAGGVFEVTGFRKCDGALELAGLKPGARRDYVYALDLGPTKANPPAVPPVPNATLTATEDPKVYRVQVGDHSILIDAPDAEEDYKLRKALGLPVTFGDYLASRGWKKGKSSVTGGTLYELQVTGDGRLYWFEALPTSAHYGSGILGSLCPKLPFPLATPEDEVKLREVFGC